MKKIDLLCLGFGVCLLLFVSCKKNDDPGAIIEYKTFFHYKMINNSGVQLAVVAEGKDFPDSVIIKNGGEYKWTIDIRSDSWPSDGRSFAKLYFNKDVSVTYDGKSLSDRNPGAPGNYEVIVIDEHNYNLTFIFTPEDYQNALEHTEK